AWMKWVIEYDLGRQGEALNGLARRLAWGRASKQWLWGALPVPLLLYGLFIAVRRLRRRPASEQATPVRLKSMQQMAYQQAFRALAARGPARRSSETGRERAGRVQQAGDPGSQPFNELVELYYAARFGSVPVPPADLERLSRRVTEAPL